MSYKLLGQREEQKELEEAFRTLRTNLLLRIKAGQRCFLVTSALPAEGKTSTAVALARCLAGMRKVLLVDADLRRPQLHNWFAISNDRGLSDCSLLQSDAAMVQSVAGISVIPGGSSLVDVQEFFTSPSFQRALVYMRANYDIILFDSPPILSVPDGLVLASMVDGVIMVLRAGVITQTEALDSVRRLESVGGQLLGFVLTGCRRDRQRRSCGPGYGVGATVATGPVIQKVLLEGGR